MFLLIHISVALASVGYLTALLLRPVTMSFMPAYLLAGSTLGTGVLLMVIQPSAILQVCISGSVYLVTATAALLFAKYRRARSVSTSSHRVVY